MHTTLSPVLAMAMLTLVLSACTATPNAPLEQGATSSTAASAAMSSSSAMAQEVASSTGTATSENAVARFTLAEVAQHADDTSCYTAIDGIVYDLTPFLTDHPGGKRDIMKICGRDGSSVFGRKHGANDEALAQLATLEIGILAP